MTTDDLRGYHQAYLDTITNQGIELTERERRLLFGMMDFLVNLQAIRERPTRLSPLQRTVMSVHG